MQRAITFITGNPSKAKQIARYLDYRVMHRNLGFGEVQSLDLREVVEHKAKEAYRQVKKPVLVEDTSLRFKSLGRLPGPLIKWFLTELGNRGLCRMLDAYDSRVAIAGVCFGLYDGKRLHFFEGWIEGSIADRPRGVKGFGWDPIFVPIGVRKTWSEMSEAEQRRTSMRRVALKKLERYLRRSSSSRR